MNLLAGGGRNPEALLALEDGTVFRGRCCGARGETFGEVVFNTSMVGYQEIVSDPSYAGQIVTLTYPQVGNYGVNRLDMQSRRLSLRGLVVRDMCHTPSNWQSVQSLPDLLEAIRARGRKGMGIYRFKGLGEMDADELFDTTMNPAKRHMLQVKLDDAVAADRMFTLLMGDEVEPRRKFIEDNALNVRNLDF